MKLDKSRQSANIEQAPGAPKGKTDRIVPARGAPLDDGPFGQIMRKAKRKLDYANAPDGPLSKSAESAFQRAVDTTKRRRMVFDAQQGNRNAAAAAARPGTRARPNMMDVINEVQRQSTEALDGMAKGRRDKPTGMDVVRDYGRKADEEQLPGKTDRLRKR